MRRDLVGWSFALAVAIVVALSFVPAFAYTPQELLDAREVHFDCDKKTKVCSMSEDDLRYMVERDALLTQLLERVAVQLKNCGVKGI